LGKTGFKRKEQKAEGGKQKAGSRRREKEVTFHVVWKTNKIQFYYCLTIFLTAAMLDVIENSMYQYIDSANETNIIKNEPVKF